jgi:hypothetical protein
MVISETPSVVRYYLEQNGRTDLRAGVLSDSNLTLNFETDMFIILQRGRTYFENKEKMDQVRNRYSIVYSACPRGGRTAVDVYAPHGAQNSAIVCDKLEL